MTFTETQQLHKTIQKNLSVMSDSDIRSTRWHVRLNAEEVGKQYIKRFGEPIAQAHPLMVGQIIQRYLVQRFKDGLL